MDIIVETLSDDAQKIGLTEESLLFAVESRLRSARLYNSNGEQHLYARVSVVGAAYSVHLEFWKELHDSLSNLSFLATTWDVGSLGTHGQDSGHVLSTLAVRLDGFLVDYLRVNEKACEER